MPCSGTDKDIGIKVHITTHTNQRNCVSAKKNDNHYLNYPLIKKRLIQLKTVRHPVNNNLLLVIHLDVGEHVLPKDGYFKVFYLFKADIMFPIIQFTLLWYEL